MREIVSVDHCIIGGGIVGLFTAYFLRQRFPNDSICLLEKNLFLGDSSTGRNSGVLHSGIYYPTNSLKHLLCIEGQSFWTTSSLFSDTSVRTTGKYIFAKNSPEEESLHTLREKGSKNNVNGLRLASTKELESISPYVKCRSALYSPSSGLINVPEVIKILERSLESNDVVIMKNHSGLDFKRNSEGFNVLCEDYDIKVGQLFNCAGLNAVEMRRKLNLNDLSDYYVKGSYLTTSQKITHPALLYPVPPKDLKGLGVHSTMNWDGSIKFGPNTQEVDTIDYSLESEDLGIMKDRVAQVFLGVDKSRLHADYSGIRAKIRKDGRLWSDFWIKDGHGIGMPGYYEACGIESPGLTASPAIAKRLVSMVKK